MRTLLPLLIALVLQAVSTALMALFNFTDLRPEPAIAVIAFTAARLDPLAGVVACSAIGFGTDLMALSPPGLHMLAFTLIYLLARSLSDLTGVTRASGALPAVLLLSAATRLLLTLQLALFTDSDARLGAWDAQLGAVLIDAALALPIWLLLEVLYARYVDDHDPGWGPL